jgi:nucleotide-binding universal stress UspA family protein
MAGIVVGVDGSVHSQWALEWAMNEAMAQQAPVTTLSVQHQRAVTYTEGDPNLDQAVEEVQALVGRVIGRRPGPAPPVTVSVVVGSPAAELIGAARDADRLAVGSRGSGGLERRGLGSVSSRVAYEAPCPVVILFQPLRHDPNGRWARWR